MSVRIPLCQDWQLTDCAPDVAPEKAFSEAFWADSVPCTAPSEVHDVYLKAGRISDPYYGMQFRESYWMEQRDFWYRAFFEVPGELAGSWLMLHCEGLDTIAEVYLNGTLLGEAHDQFIPWEFDITHEARYGERNELLLRFRPPALWIKEHGKDLSVVEGFSLKYRNWVRKSAMSFGWDNVPRVITAGPFRPVWIEAHSGPRLEDVHVTTRVQSLNQASVEVEVTVFNPAPRSLEADVQCELSCEGFLAQVSVPVRLGAADRLSEVLTFELGSPKLWWPHTKGEPHLYNLEARVQEAGQVTDVRRLRVGVREIAVLEEPQEDGGTSFIFTINGQRHFVKGFDWQPLEAIPSRLDREDYRWALAHTLALNADMLRVWGGGLREHDAFYELCDELGIMLWHDLFYACGLYPQDDPDFMALVEKEERELFRLLRNHPSIALWCGDNEIDVSFWGAFGADTWKHNLISHELTQRLRDELDPTRYYLPSSPMSRNNEHPYSRLSGNIHNWDCWHGKASHRSFNDETGRFLTEFGRYGVPNLDLLKKFIPEEALWPIENEVWRFHGGDLEDCAIDVTGKLWATLDEFGAADTLEEFVSLQQLAQATFQQYALEHFRRRKWLCGGYLYWKLADTWPCICNSILQFDRAVKPGYYYVKRANQPVICSFQDEPDGSVTAWIVNDRQLPLKLTLEVERLTFGGAPRSREVKRAEVAPDSAELIARYETGDFAPDELLWARLMEEDGALLTERFWFSRQHKELTFPPAEVSFEAELVSDRPQQVKLTVSAGAALARQVRFTPDEPVARLSDNWFDLAPNTTRQVMLTYLQRVSDPLGRLQVDWDNRG